MKRFFEDKLSDQKPKPYISPDILVDTRNEYSKQITFIWFQNKLFLGKYDAQVHLNLIDDNPDILNYLKKFKLSVKNLVQPLGASVKCDGYNLMKLFVPCILIISHI